MEIGDKLFDFKMKDAKGKTYSPDDMFRQYAILVLFFSADCDICQAYYKRLERLFTMTEDDDLGVFIVDVSPDPNFDLSEEMKELRLSGHRNIVRLLDHDHELVEKFGASFTPEAFLFDRKRELVYHGAIDDNWEFPEFVMRVYLEDAIEYTMDGMEIDFPETSPNGQPIKKD